MRRECTFKKFNNERKIVYGVVYEPFKADVHGDWASDANLEGWAHAFMAKGAVDQIDTDHDGVPSGARVVESFIARAGDPHFPPGAWVFGVQNPDHTWEKIEAGEITGFSFFGKGHRIEKGLPNNPAATHEIVDFEAEKVSQVRKAANGHRFAFKKGDDMNNPMAQILTALDSINNALEQFSSKQAKLQDEMQALSEPRSRTNLTKAQAEIVAKRDSDIGYWRNRLLAFEREYERIGEGEMGFERREVREQHVLREIRKCEMELEALGYDNRARLDDRSRSAFFQRGGVSTFLSSGPTTEYRDSEFGVSEQTRELRKSENDIDLSSLKI